MQPTEFLRPSVLSASASGSSFPFPFDDTLWKDSIMSPKVWTSFILYWVARAVRRKILKPVSVLHFVYLLIAPWQLVCHHYPRPLLPGPWARHPSLGFWKLTTFRNLLKSNPGLPSGDRIHPSTSTFLPKKTDQSYSFLVAYLLKRFSSLHPLHQPYHPLSQKLFSKLKFHLNQFRIKILSVLLMRYRIHLIQSQMVILDFKSSYVPLTLDVIRALILPSSSWIQSITFRPLC